jgi:hypothetical protein
MLRLLLDDITKKRRQACNKTTRVLHTNILEEILIQRNHHKTASQSHVVTHRG